MQSIDEILPLLTPLLDGMAKHFGDCCEFVVHDYNRDFSSTIVAIANGQVTGRKVGQGGSKLGLRIMQGKEEEDGKYNYLSQTQDGRFLRSSTIYLKGEDGTILGSLCINIDVSEFIRSRNFLEKMIGADLPQTQQKGEELVLFSNVEELLVALITDSINHVGVPVAHMTREQKVEGITYLNRRGAFKIKNAAITVAKYYDISRYTIYNYLNDANTAD